MFTYLINRIRNIFKNGYIVKTEPEFKFGDIRTQVNPNLHVNVGGLLNVNINVQRHNSPKIKMHSLEHKRLKQKKKRISRFFLTSKKVDMLHTKKG